MCVFQEGGLPWAWEGMKCVVEPSWIRAREKASAPVRAELCHWKGCFWERKILGNAAAWAGKWMGHPCPWLLRCLRASQGTRTPIPSLPEDNFSAASPVLYSEPHIQDWSLSSFTPARENRILEVYFFFEHHIDCAFWVHWNTAFLKARWGRQICSLAELEGRFNWIQ